MGIAKKLVLAFLLAGAIPLLIAGAIEFRADVRHADELVRMRLEDNVTQTARSIDTFMFNGVRDVQAVAAALRSGLTQEPATEALLSDLQQINSTFSTLLFVGPDARIRAAAPVGDESVLANHPGAQRLVKRALHAEAGQVLVSDLADDYQSGVQPGNASIGFLAPVHDRNGNLRGVVVAIADVSRLSALLQNLRKHTVGHGDATVIDSVGHRALLTTDTTLVLGSVVSDSHWTGGARSMMVSATLARYGGNLGGGGQLIALAPYDAIMEPVKQTLWTTLTVVAVLLVATAALAFAFARSLARPIIALTHRVEAIAAGNYSARAEASGSAEAVQLADAFNRMTDAVFAKTQALEDEIAERKAQQEELRHARAAAEAANKAKGEFLANMSHEIRTPMNGVIGMTELLLETKLNSMQHDYAETIRESGKALLTVINDILDFSKIEAGKLELECIDLDVRDTIEDVARLVAVQAHAKGLGITAQIDPKLPDLLSGDAGRLRQILLNLAGNAVKFTRAGEVSLEAKVAGCDERGVLVRCEVRDTGIGIPPDRLQALFTPFTQVDNSMTRKYGGTGLGLSIAQRLAALMGGEVGVESKVGVGSIFWFTARFAHAAVGKRPIAQNMRSQSIVTRHALRLPRSHAMRRILLAEDNPVNQKVATRLLEKLDYRVDAVSDGKAAVAAWSTGRYDLILMDCQMPELDGYEATREIRQLEKGRGRIPIVALTAHAMKGADEECIAAGMDAYLTKPIDREALAATLARFLAEETPMVANA